MVDNINQYLFVYGTLKRKYQHPIFTLLVQHAEYYAEAFFNGKLFLLTGYPCAIPSNQPEDRVLGELYQLKQPDVLLYNLDAYEGCSEQYPEPKEYVRGRRLVHSTDRITIGA